MDDYPYINARIRAMRSDLLAPRFFDDLLSLPDAASVGHSLVNTVYSRVVGDLSAHDPVSGLEGGLRQEWSRAVNKVHGMASGKPRELLEIFLERWEMENLKGILRGKKAEAGVAEIMTGVLPTGILGEGALAELARQPSLQVVVDLLATWRSHYAGPLKKAMKSRHELNELEPLELALDRDYYENAVKNLEGGSRQGRLVRPFMGFLIDRVNILTAFKISTGGGTTRPETARYFLEGGLDFPFTVYSRIVQSRDIREMVDSARNTSYGDLFQGLEDTQRRLPSSAWLGGELDRRVLHRAKSVGLKDPLGMGLVVGYLFQKYHEIGNLRIILRGMNFEMYPEDIRSLLVI
jgi:V/A-type H+/Na+-transporting ATPase subunit C